MIANRATLLRFFTSRTRDPAEAEEIVQELYLRLGRVPGGPIADPLAYLYRIGLNLVVDHRRAQQRRTQREGDWGDATTSRIGDDLVDEAPSAFTELAAREREQQIAAVVAAMPPGAAEAFMLHKVQGLSHREVAEQLGISRKAVEKRMAVAFRHLTRELQE